MARCCDSSIIREREEHVEAKGERSVIFESTVHSPHLFDFGARRQSTIRSNAILSRNESVLFARSVSNSCSPAAVVVVQRTECLSPVEHCTLFGYSTPPRSTRIVQSPHFSHLFHQPKLLTSAELKRRFSPILKPRRAHLAPLPINRRTDGVVPLKRSVLPLPTVLPRLFVEHQDDDFIVSLCSDVPPATTMAYPPSSFDPFASHALKSTQENAFTISEKTLKDKLQALLKQS